MILVFLESSGAQLPKSALVAAQAAIEAKTAHGYEKAVGVLLGADGVADAAAKAALLGLDEIVFFNHSSLSPYLVLNHAAALRHACEQLNPQLLLAASTTLGKDLLPRAAHFLKAGQASDVTAFLPGGKFRRLMYAGNITAEVELLRERKAATVRLTAFDPAAGGTIPCPVRELSAALNSDHRQKFISFDVVKSERPELTEAEVVVSGGRAMKSAENFEAYIAPLADALGAAIGASRAAVDSGYAPNDWQVGQTGKVVAPGLYVAVGISGAIQHLAGMKDSKVIVAINKDAEAPIFEVADYGLVGDLYEVLPQLTEELKKAKD